MKWYSERNEMIDFSNPKHFMGEAIQYKGKILLRTYKAKKRRAGYDGSPHEGDVQIGVYGYYGDPDEWPNPPEHANQTDIEFIYKTYPDFDSW
jgi:hypothetical protein